MPAARGEEGERVVRVRPAWCELAARKQDDSGWEVGGAEHAAQVKARMAGRGRAWEQEQEQEEEGEGH